MTDAYFIHTGDQLHLLNAGQLELLRGMVARGVSLRTTVRGFSMFPFIRDNDVLTITPGATRLGRLGDVVAFVHPGNGRLAIHRLVAKSSHFEK